MGIDVSHHQGAIDWTRVRDADVAFAIIEATEGVTFTDPAFAENWRSAGRAGLLRGAYHFLTFCTPGRDQASAGLGAGGSGAEAIVPCVEERGSGIYPRRLA